MSETLGQAASVELLSQAISLCRRCPRLVTHRERVARVKRRAFRDEVYWGRPVPGNGDARARVLLVGLAPGAHGSNRTGRMFTGDGSAEFLTPALFHAGFASQPTSLRRDDGLRLTDVFVVAAAHCAPPGNRPTLREIARCRPFLVEHLTLLNHLQVIVCLGKIALDATLAAADLYGLTVPRPRPHFAHGAEWSLGAWTVISTYHPSRQNTQTGRLTMDMLDEIFRRVRVRLREVPA